MRDFEFVVAASPAEARALASRGDARFYAGGTTLVDLMKADVERPQRVIDISRLPLAAIEECDDDPNVEEDRLVILDDGKRILPRHHLTPVIRMETLRRHSSLGAALDRVTHTLTSYALQSMSMRRDLLRLDPSDVAEDFLRRHH